MTGWHVSRHPEWDMMYASGLTVREISDRCHSSVATVHLHLKVREKYAPGLHATHEVALARRDSDRPTTRWRGRLDDVLAFQAAHRRLPISSTDEAERSLARWVAVQRRAYQKGRMSAAKVILLDALAGWEVDPQQQRRDESWRAKLVAVGTFVSSTGAMPRYKNAATEHERALGVWLHVQHQRRAESTLQAWRLAALNQAVPYWYSRS